MFRKNDKIKRKQIEFKSRIGPLINKVLFSSSKISPVRPENYSIKLKDVISRSSMNLLKKEKYDERWKLRGSSEGRKRPQKEQKVKTDEDILEKLYPSKSETKMKTITIGGQKSPLLVSLGTFEFPTGAQNAMQIVHKSRVASCEDNPLMNYENTLKQKIGDYVEYTDELSNIYDFDQVVQKDIAKMKVGISIPGNCINYSDDETFKYIKVIHPSFIKEYIRRHIEAPEKTQLPHPRGMKEGTFTRVTYKEVYSDKMAI